VEQVVIPFNERFLALGMNMCNLRTVATQKCSNPSFVKNFTFHIFRATANSYISP